MATSTSLIVSCIELGQSVKNHVLGVQELNDKTTRFCSELECMVVLMAEVQRNSMVNQQELASLLRPIHQVC
jgi:hypothetical protein